MHVIIVMHVGGSHHISICVKHFGEKKGKKKQEEKRLRKTRLCMLVMCMLV